MTIIFDFATVVFLQCFTEKNKYIQECHCFVLGSHIPHISWDYSFAAWYGSIFGGVNSRYIRSLIKLSFNQGVLLLLAQ